MAQQVASAPSPSFAGPAGGKPPIPRRGHHRDIYGALDLGTNNCRLLIARPSEDGFTVLDAFSRIVRLGHGMSVRGIHSQEWMDRAVEALSICADKLRRRHVTLARTVAMPVLSPRLNVLAPIAPSAVTAIVPETTVVVPV